MSRVLFEYHPVIGYRFIPGLRARVAHIGGGYLVECNRSGFRCRHEVTPNTPAGTVRIIVIGDSYTAGEGVSNAFRFSDLLEKHLVAASPGAKIQILNFGLPATGTDQQLLAFREFARSIEYDVLLLVPLVGNLVRNLDTHQLVHNFDSHLTTSAGSGRLMMRPKPYFTLHNGILELHQVPVPKDAREMVEYVETGPTQCDGTDSLVRAALRRATAEIDKRIPGFRTFTQRLRGSAVYPIHYRSAQDPGWMLMRAILEMFIDDVRQVAGRTVILAPFPTFGHVDGVLNPKPYIDRFTELARARCVDFIDVLPRFKEEPRSVRLCCRFALDEHPTRLGHSIYADAVFSHLHAHIRGILSTSRN